MLVQLKTKVYEIDLATIRITILLTSRYKVFAANVLEIIFANNFVKNGFHLARPKLIDNMLGHSRARVFKTVLRFTSLRIAYDVACTANCNHK